MDNAFNQPFNNQLIWDVRLGIGTDKFVFNAQPDGPSTQREFVSQFLTTVTNGMLQELVPLVSLDINSPTVNANLQTLFARVSIHQEPVLHAITDMFCIKTTVLQFRNWLTSSSTTQLAAQKNSNNLNKKEDFENRLNFFLIYIFIFYYSRLILLLFIKISFRLIESPQNS